MYHRVRVRGCPILKNKVQDFQGFLMSQNSSDRQDWSNDTVTMAKFVGLLLIIDNHQNLRRN